MAVTQFFKPPMPAGTQDDFRCDFALNLATGETIASAAVTATAALIISGAAEIGTWNATTKAFTAAAGGTWVQQRIQAGSADGNAQIIFAIETSNGRTLRATFGVAIAPRS